MGMALKGILLKGKELAEYKNFWEEIVTLQVCG